LLNFDAYGLDVAYIYDAIVYEAIRSNFPVACKSTMTWNFVCQKLGLSQVELGKRAGINSTTS
jgi:hypothetical protein